MAVHGGKRPGSGRKIGSGAKPHIADYWTDDQIKTFFNGLYERAEKDARLAVWCGDQLSGKAQQSVDLTSGGKPLLLDDDGA